MNDIICIRVPLNDPPTEGVKAGSPFHLKLRAASQLAEAYGVEFRWNWQWPGHVQLEGVAAQVRVVSGVLTQQGLLRLPELVEA